MINNTSDPMTAVQLLIASVVVSIFVGLLNALCDKFRVIPSLRTTLGVCLGFVMFKLLFAL